MVIFCLGGAGMSVEEEVEDSASDALSSSFSSSSSWPFFVDLDFGWAVWNRLSEEGRAVGSTARSFPFPLLFELDVFVYPISDGLGHIEYRRAGPTPENRSISFLNRDLSNLAPPAVSKLNADAILCVS